MKNKSEQYAEYINENILSRIDYDLLQKSYMTKDKAYAKGVLNLLHKAMVDLYRTETLRPNYRHNMDDNFVLIPGVVQAKNSNALCLALLEIDLSSSGEHWGTTFLTEYGVIPQSADDEVDPKLTELMVKRYIPYNHCYTAKIPGDIHTGLTKMPKTMQDVLRTFHEYTAELLPPETEEYPVEEDEEDLEL